MKIMDFTVDRSLSAVFITSILKGRNGDCNLQKIVTISLGALFMKTVFILFFVNILISALYSLIDPQSFFTSFVNATFLIGLFFLTIGLFLFVYGGGFFDGIMNSFKQIRKMSKEGQYVSQFDPVDQTVDSRLDAGKRKIRFTNPLIITGSFFVVLDLMIAFLFSP